MRNIVCFNEDWLFLKGCGGPSAFIEDRAEPVSLPHTWNGEDGQDGGNDYYRGPCCYRKTFRLRDLPESHRWFLEIGGANAYADVYLNGKRLAHHDGGYSLWRAELTPALEQENELFVAVDNTDRKDIYPRIADFTFYGGLYRDVNLIGVPDMHFELGAFGTPGIRVTSEVRGKDAVVTVDAPICGGTGREEILFRILDAEGETAAEQTGDPVFLIRDAHLWDGRRDPYLYTAEAVLCRDGEELDRVSARFGCRTFSVDPDKGFFLNGRYLPLHGVCRHQDREKIGNALRKEHHLQDMELIAELGANTIRLAHYQHDRYFYDLCDEYGMIVWAEIPYISKHISAGNENAEQQMRELIIQCANHPSICFWGLSNEITMEAAEGKDLLEEHRRLNGIVRELDGTRLTTMACFAACGVRNPILRIPDLVSYNLYFGWYTGTMDRYGSWFDRFHRLHPDLAVGCSEYGCEALDWHSAEPVRGDYTEEYQAIYHETVIRQLFSRPYLWATHVWNMFDFGADARMEGGRNGRNHKGLVTIDRKYKKDAFYIYKAWLSDEPFVHICGKRRVNREEAVTEIRIYSNLPEAELFVNGVSAGTEKAEDHVCVFRIPNRGESVLRAVSGGCEDTALIRKVPQADPAYAMPDPTAVRNWNENGGREDGFRMEDRLSDLLRRPAGWGWLLSFLFLVLRKAVRREHADAAEGGILSFHRRITVGQYVGLFRRLRFAFSDAELAELGRKLNRIRRIRRHTER